MLLTALSVAGAFGIARLIFQDGHLSGVLNFEPQGFVDAWAPLFFGAMVFGVAMDYTLFMLSAAKESYETHVDPEHAMVGSVRTSGRVVVSVSTKGDGGHLGRRCRPRRFRRAHGASAGRASLRPSRELGPTAVVGSCAPQSLLQALMRGTKYSTNALGHRGAPTIRSRRVEMYVTKEKRQ